MNKKVILSTFGFGLATVLSMTGCDISPNKALITSKSESGNVAKGEKDLESVVRFEGNFIKEMQSLNLNGTSIYEDLKVTGKKLGTYYIYFDTSCEQYVIISGDTKIYLPITNHGVVELRDGVYTYKDECSYRSVDIIVGECRDIYRDILSCQTIPGENAVCMNGRYLSVKVEEKEGKLYYSVLDLANELDLEYKVTSGASVLSMFDQKLIIDFLENGSVEYNGMLTDKSFEVYDNEVYVDMEFLEEVLCIECNLENNFLTLTSGPLVPCVIELDRYTKTDANLYKLDKSKLNPSFAILGESELECKSGLGSIKDEINIVARSIKGKKKEKKSNKKNNKKNKKVSKESKKNKKGDSKR